MEWDEVVDFAEFVTSIETFVQEYGNPNSFSAWESGWRVGMSILGFKTAHLGPVFEDDEGVRSISYSWCDDQDDMNKAYLDRTDRNGAAPGGWNAAHACFLAMEPMRPRYVEPSRALQEMIDQRNSKETN